MKVEIQKKLDSIFKYPFFESVGKPLSGSVTKVDNWQLAIEVCKKDRKWENCRLMARNALQRFTEQRDWNRAQDWNPLADELRPLIVSFVDTLVAKAPESLRIVNRIKGTLCWDIMFICLEYEYRDIVRPFFYIPVLEPWYVAGHFPCGWDGEQFPEGWDGVIRDGRLMVF